MATPVIREGSTAMLSHSVRLLDDVLARVEANTSAASAEADFDLGVALMRIAHGTFGVASNIVVLVLCVTVVGIPAAILVLALTGLLQLTAGAAWTAFASYRSGRTPQGSPTAGAGGGAAEATPTDGSATGDAAIQGAVAVTPATDDDLIENIMTLLQDRSDESTDARKLLKRGLREHGLSRLALQLMKFGNAFGHTMVDTLFREKAVALVRAQLRNLLTGDTARTAVAEQRVVERVTTSPPACSVAASQSTLASAVC